MKRVMVDQGCGAEIMYLDLYKGLNLKLEDLSKHDTLLVGFDRKVVTSEGWIKLGSNQRKGSGSQFYRGLRLFTLHDYFRKALDPCNGGSTIDATLEN